MGLLQDLIRKQREKKRAFKEMQTQDKFAEMVQERKKSANERELERFLEEERQKQIKVHLEDFRKKQRDELFEQKILTKENMFKGGRQILKEPNIFANQKNIFTGNKGMFFK